MAHSDSKREVFLECYAAVSISDHLEIQIIRNWVVIEDSEQERIERESRQALLLESHADDLILARILTSHRNSLHDPDNDFVHLYEIWDALESKFLKRHQVADALKIKFSKFGQFQTVCNRPTLASRHRGTADGALRQPTPAEYELARSIAWELVIGYAEWLCIRPLRATDVRPDAGPGKVEPLRFTAGSNLALCDSWNACFSISSSNSNRFPPTAWEIRRQASGGLTQLIL